MNDLKIVRSILSKYYNIDENPTYIFGSRANNTHRENSDLDVFIDDRNISSETIAMIEEDFENSELLYKVDLVLKSRIDNKFYAQISQTLVPLQK